MFQTGAREFLKSSFDLALAKPTTRGAFRYATFALAYAASSDFHPVASRTLFPFLSAFGDVRKLIKMANAIDDVVDTTPLGIVASADFSRDKNGVSNFLHDTRFIPPDFLPTLKSLHAKRVLDYTVGVGFSNLFCDCIHDRVVRQISLEAHPDKNERLSMAQDNLNFAGTFGSFFFALVQPPKAFLQDGVSHNAVRKAYPDIYQLSLAGQMLDDLGDLMIDIDDEVQSGRTSPNIILGTVRHGIERGELMEIASTLRSDRNISLRVMPSALRVSVLEVGEQFAEAVSTVKSCVSRTILESFWRNTRAEGFPTVDHPRIVKKRAEEAKAIRALDMRMPN